jgi:hypothetical protein
MEGEVAYMLGGKHEAEMQFVVVPKPLTDRKEMKVFDGFERALAYSHGLVKSDAESVSIYSTDTSDARTAIAALDLGEGELVQAVGAAGAPDKVEVAAFERLWKELGF